MDQVIEYMKTLGWIQCDGYVTHPNLDIDFKDWWDAIKSCMDVATPE
jgi:hypothetical protein